MLLGISQVSLLWHHVRNAHPQHAKEAHEKTILPLIITNHILLLTPHTAPWTWWSRVRPDGAPAPASVPVSHWRQTSAMASTTAPSAALGYPAGLCKLLLPLSLLLSPLSSLWNRILLNLLTQLLIHDPLEPLLWSFLGLGVCLGGFLCGWPWGSDQLT